MYSVISCDRDFKPSFPIEGGSKEATVTLRGSRFDTVLSNSRGEGLTADYFQGVTANTYYFDLFYGGNPSNYKSFAWGLSDGCPNGDQEVATVELGDAGTPKLQRGEYHGDVSRGGRSVAKFRHRSFVNAYAETAPGIFFDRVTRGFQIGVDRILTRTVP
jgi:hypothetical protein